MTIHAHAAFAPGEKLKPYSFQTANLMPFEVDIKITHCGICHSDIHLIDDDWRISRYPLVPGHEVVGTISRLGSAVEQLKIGQRVGVGWQSGSCMSCEWCIRGEENLCVHDQATCVGRPGGFADRIITDSRFTFPIPDTLESENTAPLLCGGITVYSPLRHYQVRPEMKVGVIGIGGLGHLALQYTRAYGCEVTGFSSSSDKEADAREFGAHHFVTHSDKKKLNSLKRQFDFLLSTVYVQMDWNLFTDLLRPHGNLVFVGAGGMLHIPANTLFSVKSVGGSAIGSRAMIREMLEFSARHSIKAVTEPVPMSKVNQAVDKVRQGKARYRMVLINP
jgi:alcohol/geraniol dehydrogenase (NADP+)